MAGSFLIFLREGIEGSMICAILLTYLAAGGRRDLFRWVLGGAAGAGCVSALVGRGLFFPNWSGFLGSRPPTRFRAGPLRRAGGGRTDMTFLVNCPRPA